MPAPRWSRESSTCSDSQRDMGLRDDWRAISDAVEGQLLDIIRLRIQTVVRRGGEVEVVQTDLDLDLDAITVTTPAAAHAGKLHAAFMPSSLALVRHRLEA